MSSRTVDCLAILTTGIYGKEGSSAILYEQIGSFLSGLTEALTAFLRLVTCCVWLSRRTDLVGLSCDVDSQIIHCVLQYAVGKMDTGYGDASSCTNSRARLAWSKKTPPSQIHRHTNTTTNTIRQRAILSPLLDDVPQLNSSRDITESKQHSI